MILVEQVNAGSEKGDAIICAVKKFLHHMSCHLAKIDVIANFHELIFQSFSHFHCGNRENPSRSSDIFPLRQWWLFGLFIGVSAAVGNDSSWLQLAFRG